MLYSYRLGYATPGDYMMTVVEKDKDGQEVKKNEYEVKINEN
jgi:hypothetical protein